MATQARDAARKTIARAAADAAERYPDRIAVRAPDGDGGWAEQTFAEVGAIVDEIAAGLVEAGLRAGDRVCILANTRPEWTFASLAISRAGGVVVPIYPTNSPEECEWVAGNSEARFVICEDPSQVAKIVAVRDRLDALEQLFVMDGGSSDDARALDELRRSEPDTAELDARCEAVEPDDAYTIIYTSGTTGPPKGVVLTHGNCASVGKMVEELGFIKDEDMTYLFLPLAHVFALTVQIGSYDVGTGIIYFGGDPKQIVGELGATRPTYFPSVPRIFEKIYTLATQAVAQADEETRRGFEAAVEVGAKVRQMRQRGEEVPDELQQHFDAAEERLYKNVRGLFGGNINQAVTGAAPIAPEIVKFFYACGVTVLEGWGMTETTGVGCVNRHDAIKFGSIGKPLPGVDVRIADDGEIQVKGPNVFREYWRNPDATRETFTEDGWLMTGDLGEIDDEGFVSITGRKKDIIITAGGKNLTPANIENDLKQSRWISQAVMHGDRRPYPVALITLDEEEIVPWATEQGIEDTSIPALARDEQVRRLIQDVLDEVNQRHAKVAQIKKFVLLDHDLSQETGELTPTLKVKRNVVAEKYADLFEGLYSGS